MKEFKGIFTALLTPFDKNGAINENALAELIERNLKMGVTGFYVCGSTAEVFLLSSEERRELMRLCAEIVGERATLIAQVGAIGTRESAKLAEYAEELGYDAISSVAPFYYKFTPDEIVGYYNDVASATKLGMLIYNIPALSGVSLGAASLSGMLADEKFIGVKHTSSDFFALEAVKSRFPEKLIYNGYDEMFLQGLTAGADGGIGSTYNFMADKFVKIRELFNEGRLDEARAIQHEANEIIRVLIKVGVNAGEKAVLNLLGLDFGGVRKPFKDCPKEDLILIEKEILPRL